MTRDSFRDLVERWRARTGLSIEDLARLVGRSRATVFKWVAGDVSPDPTIWITLARVLGVRVSDVDSAVEASLLERQRRAKEVS